MSQRGGAGGSKVGKSTAGKSGRDAAGSKRTPSSRPQKSHAEKSTASKRGASQKGKSTHETGSKRGGSQMGKSGREGSMRGSMAGAGKASKGGETKEQKAARRQQKHAEHLRRRLCIIGFAVIALIVVAIVIIVLIIYLTKKPGPTPTPIRTTREITAIKEQPMVRECQAIDEEGGGCYYFKDKFVKDCKNVECASMMFEMDILVESDFSGGKIKATIQWYPPLKNDTKMIPVPKDKDVPCESGGKHGICENGECNVTNSNHSSVVWLESQKPRNGQWTIQDGTDESTIRCIKWPEYNNYFYQKKFSQCEVPAPCYPYSVKYLTCSKMLPSLGGLPCWTERDTYSVANWAESPLTIGDKCTACKSAIDELPQEYPNCAVDIPPDQCEFETRAVKPNMKQFYPCCLEKFDDASKYPPGTDGNTTGRCFINMCIPENAYKL